MRARLMMPALALAAASLASAQQRPLDWLVGSWCTDAGDGEQTCETWSPMGADRVMRGTSETRSAKGRTGEKMRIIDDAGRLVFRAEPEGQAPAEFRSTVRDHAPDRLEFANPAHDYPQRIRYWREGELLKAEISLIDGSKPTTWTYRRVR